MKHGNYFVLHEGKLAPIGVLEFSRPFYWGQYFDNFAGFLRFIANKPILDDCNNRMDWADFIAAISNYNA